ncbi:unnamed protein product [Ceutorhynchus assimilis]|uniref:ATP-dependent DNA helicase n=1 Tax=Ceutorhynchus assimilis TaxID=467358 RepID=A0A9N9MM68_9CUCU|nr:unnamed protein product [Ceutorhynchus assimilis]
MNRRKITRTPEEEEEVMRLRRERNNENQRRSRERAAQIEKMSGNSNAEQKNEKITQTQHQRNYRSRQHNFIDLALLRLENSTSEHYIGVMNISCIHCGARHFASEKVANRGNSFNDCCGHGQIRLEPLPTLPANLQSLFCGSHPKSRFFFEHIRSYNSSFSFASFNANLVKFSSRPGPYCFKIHGQIYYQINTALYPSSSENPCYGQLFIVDAHEAAEFRQKNNSECDMELMELIDDIMRENNVFVHSYQMMNEEIENQKSMHADYDPELQLLFTLKPGVDKNRYNFQRVNEVAAVFSTTADGDIPESYVTIRNKNDKSLQYVSSMDPNVEPWIYPLFYPFGTRGWHQDIKCVNKSRRVTRAAYTKYRIAVRDEISVFLKGRRLFQQWLVDSYVKIEKDRINFCKENQKKLRAESYQGLVDHLQKRAEDQNGNVGKMVVLPSTFQGSPRNMLQNYQDAMTIVRKHGKPDLFITMTCNPKWREISENLLPGQHASDRPDLVARVFNIKKNALVDLVVNQNFFGEVQAYVYVIEFQKRGLPHVHMLVTLKQSQKITTPEIVDRYISAEIPDFQEEPILHNIVLGNMVHGPCGDWCLTEEKTCSKNYPKQFREETTMDENGYPYYRRRNPGMSFKRSSDGYVCDNRYVVPHNPTLLKLFNGHINVEVVSSIKSVKYLYKYVYKGHDAANIIISESNSTTIEHDEIRNFIETRYVGPVEAAWRILEKPLQDKSHSITRLPVHLPNQQNVFIADDCDDNEIRSALERQTMLIDYFALNSRNPEARQYSYSTIPTYYVFKKVDGKYQWIHRQRQFNVIGRMYSVSPTQTELFHLRILLLHVKGPLSFEDIKTVNGVRQESFMAACLELGLIEDDHEWKRAMNEAEIWMMPRQLRYLFVRILIHCQPIHPEELWEEFKDALSEDYRRKYNGSQDMKKAYVQLDSMLNLEGWSISMFPTMPQITDLDNVSNDMEILNEEEAFDTLLNQYDSLNAKQKEIVDFILEKADNQTDENNEETSCIYIDGPGGSGKTYLYTTLYGMLKTRNKNVCTMAFTGIAATLLPHGRTVHKTFGLPVPLFSDSNSSIKNNTKEANYLKSVDVFIWDEAPMAPKDALEVIERTLRDLTNNRLPFGAELREEVEQKTRYIERLKKQSVSFAKEATSSENILIEDLAKKEQLISELRITIKELSTKSPNCGNLFRTLPTQTEISSKNSGANKTDLSPDFCGVDQRDGVIEKLHCDMDELRNLSWNMTSTIETLSVENEIFANEVKKLQKYGFQLNHPDTKLNGEIGAWCKEYGSFTKTEADAMALSQRVLLFYCSDSKHCLANLKSILEHSDRLKQESNGKDLQILRIENYYEKRVKDLQNEVNVASEKK